MEFFNGKSNYTFSFFRYDKHREQILKSGERNCTVNLLDTFAFFNSSCYKKFNDDQDGFYTVYRNVFNSLAAEDIEYLEENEYENIPGFGTSKSSFDDVTKFYSVWESYSTKNSYAWLFPHNINEVRDRRVLKLIDKEHKKIQQKARKERNEEVRSLVLFVKKRDKRMAEYRRMLEERANENRLKSQKDRLEQLKKRSEDLEEQKNNMKFHEKHEEQLKNLEKEYFNHYSDSEEEYDSEEKSDTTNDDEEVHDDLYCVACNKFFNSIKAKSNHEASKKHKQNLQLLKTEMHTEENSFQKNDDFKQTESENEEEEEIIQNDSPSDLIKNRNKKKKKVNNIDHKPDNIIHNLMEMHENIENHDDKEVWDDRKKNKKTKKKLKPKSVEGKKLDIFEGEVDSLSLGASKSIDSQVPEKEMDNKCATCNQVFPSKNKLFAHLKATKHSVYIGNVNHNLEKTKSQK